MRAVFWAAAVAAAIMGAVAAYATLAPRAPETEATPDSVAHDVRLLLHEAAR